MIKYMANHKSNATRRKSRRGFFFVLATLLVLGYILTSLALWTKSIESAERAYSEKFKISNLELVVSQISQEKIQKFADISAYYALYSVNSRAVESPLKQGSASDPYFHVRNTLWNLIKEGAVDAADFEASVSGYSPDEISDFTFKGWSEKLNKTVSFVGLEMKDLELYDFAFNQLSANKLNYSFAIKFSISDRTNTAYVKRSYKINGTLDIAGLVDPAVARETSKDIGRKEKQFFFLYENLNGVGPYSRPEDVVPSLIETGTEGQGWFYGPAFTVEEAKTGQVGIFNVNSSILVGSYADIIGLVGVNKNELHYEQFGAYILTNAPKEIDSCGEVKVQKDTFNPFKCDNGKVSMEFSEGVSDKPFAVVPGFSLDKVTSYPNVGHAILFVNKYSPSAVHSSPSKKKDSAPAVYDIEELRDLAICGYYVKNPDAPSYLQRLFKDSYKLKDPDFGIESFVFGMWIGGNAPKHYDDESSRLERELLDAIPEFVNKVRGMPGCKSADMCNSDSPIGHFHLTETAASDYFDTAKEKILCKDSECKEAG